MRGAPLRRDLRYATTGMASQDFLPFLKKGKNLNPSSSCHHRKGTNPPTADKWTHPTGNS